MAIKFTYDPRDVPGWAAKLILDVSNETRVSLLTRTLDTRIRRLGQWGLKCRRPQEPSWLIHHPLVVAQTTRTASLVLEDPELLKNEKYQQAILLAETVLSVRG